MSSGLSTRSALVGSAHFLPTLNDSKVFTEVSWLHRPPAGRLALMVF